CKKRQLRLPFHLRPFVAASDYTSMRKAGALRSRRNAITLLQVIFWPFCGACMSRFVVAVILCAAFAGARAETVLREPLPVTPEAGSGYSVKPGWTAQKFMVAAANPLAVDAGYKMLKQGGSAVDAALAVQMVLTLVEPQSSGIGGGAFLLHFDGRQVHAVDGREPAP